MRFSLRSLLAVLVLAIGLSGSMARGADILTPAGLNPGDKFRFIFVTTSIIEATSTNIADYNTFVQTDAAGYTYGGQPITWNAIGSTSAVDARDNVGGFNTNVPVYLVTGTKVANDLTGNAGGLWSGSISAAVDKTISGGTDTVNNIWTGSLANGQASSFPIGAGLVTMGFTAVSDSSWLNNIFGGNSSFQAMYGLSADLVVPVPEPSTYALGTISAGTLSWLARRRKKQAGA